MSCFILIVRLIVSFYTLFYIFLPLLYRNLLLCGNLFSAFTFKRHFLTLYVIRYILVIRFSMRLLFFLECSFLILLYPLFRHSKFLLRDIYSYCSTLQHIYSVLLILTSKFPFHLSNSSMVGLFYLQLKVHF